MQVNEMHDMTVRIRDNISRVIVGCTETVDLLIVALLAQGHVLLEDVPGTGKTMVTKSLARSIDCTFSRIQFTPDILPSDITGIDIYNQKTQEFSFHEGPIFANIVLADEINRATPRSQSALLECMEERQVTVGGTTYRLSPPFCVIATQNPVETQGTFPLPEAQLDRFFIKTRMGYPEAADAVAILDRFIEDNPLARLEPVVAAEQLIEAQQSLGSVTVSAPVRRYIVDVTAMTRKMEGVLLGVSPRGSLALMRASQAWAVLQGRDYVLPDDVKAVAVPVLAHRIMCRSAYGAMGDAAQKVVADVLRQVAVPGESVDAVP